MPGGSPRPRRSLSLAKSHRDLDHSGVRVRFIGTIENSGLVSRLRDEITVPKPIRRFQTELGHHDDDYSRVHRFRDDARLRHARASATCSPLLGGSIPPGRPFVRPTPQCLRPDERLLHRVSSVRRLEPHASRAQSRANSRWNNSSIGRVTPTMHQTPLTSRRG